MPPDRISEIRRQPRPSLAPFDVGGPDAEELLHGGIDVQVASRFILDEDHDRAVVEKRLQQLAVELGPEGTPVIVHWCRLAPLTI